MPSLTERLPIHPHDLPPTKESAKLGMSFGSYLPKQELTNQEMATWNIRTKTGLLTADDILNKTGVEKRYIAGKEETPYYMAREAAAKALEGNRNNMDVVIVSTSYIPDEDLSKKLQEEFGFSGFQQDVYAACSGIGARLAYFKRRERQFMGNRVLFVAVEKPSEHLHNLKEDGGSKKDPSLAQTLFSDGAFAVVFEYGKDLRLLSVKEHTFEGTGDYIKMPIDRSKLGDRRCFELPILYPESGKFEQEGSKVYKLVRNNVPDFIRKSISEAGLMPADIAMVFPHQGSGRVVEAIIDNLPEFDGRIWRDYRDGNPSSGSAPKGMMRAMEKGAIKKGDFVNVTFFGAGARGMGAFSATLQI